MAILQATTISGSINDTGSLQITGSTLLPPQIESSLTSSFTSSGLLWINADNFNLQYTTETSKGSIQSPASFMGAWSAGANLPTATSYAGSTGVQNAFLFAGGATPSTTNATKEYDGTSWTAGGNMITSARSRVGGGLIDAAIMATSGVPFGGATEEYDGSSWSAGGNMIVSRGVPGGAGLQNAFFIAGGYNPSKVTCTEEYNGSAWSTGTAMIVGLREGTIGGAGTQNAGLVLSGISTGDAICGCTDHYDGTSWSLGNPQLTPRIIAGAAGTQNAVSYFGGLLNPVHYNLTEEFNGLTWVNGCNLTTARAGIAGGNGTSSQNATLAAGGYTPTIVACVEEYTKSDIVPYTTSVWSSGAGNIVNKSGGLGAGDSNAALSFGGNISPSTVACTEEYDGTNWSAGGAMIIARINHGGTGTANAALAAGGEPASCCKAEEYNGTSWASGGNLSQGGYGNATLGTQNSAISFGGNFTGKKAESYDGSSWSTISDMNCCRRASGGGAGTSNAAIVFQGRCYTAPTTCQLTLSEEWNGASWSIGASYTTAASNGVAGGETVSTALSAGGYNPSNPTGTFQTELYDGTSWSAGGNALNIMKYSAGHSVADSGFAVGGNPGSQNNIAQFYDAVCSTTLCNAFGAWSVAGKNIIPRESRGFSGQGTQNAVWLAGGRAPGSAPYGCFNTELYDGTTWSAGNDITFDAIARAGTGTQNAGLLAGGFDGGVQSTTEEFNGSTWSGGGSMSNALYGRIAVGIQNDALVWGGSPTQTCTEEYNGSSFSTGGAFNTGAKCQSGIGASVNAALAFGVEPAKNCVQEYDGSSWSAGPNLINNRSISAAAGTTNAGVTFGGRVPTSPDDASSTSTEEWNGSTFSAGRHLNLGSRWVGGAGSQTSAIMQAGNSYTGLTEEYTCTLTGNCVGAWSQGGNLILGRCIGTGFGTSTSALFIGGYNNPSGHQSVSEEYNGTSWSAGGAIGIGAREGAAGFGTQNAGVIASGNSSTNSLFSDSQNYDGSSWSTSGNVITARWFAATSGAGIQNAGVIMGGRTPTAGSAVSCVEEYNGSAWSSGGALIQARWGGGSAGTQNASTYAGGSNGPADTYYCNTEEYNGTAWTASNKILKQKTNVGSSTAGTQNDYSIFNGYTPTDTSTHEVYNGIAWSTQTATPKDSRGPSGAGKTTNSLVFGGESSETYVVDTFHFNCDTLLGAGSQINRTEVSVS